MQLGLGRVWSEESLSAAVPWVLQTEYARYENGHYSYRIHRSPLCEYMINFIHKLKHLPEKYMMNSVLENFTILQVRGLQGCGGPGRAPGTGAQSGGGQTHRSEKETEPHRGAGTAQPCAA